MILYSGSNGFLTTTILAAACLTFGTNSKAADLLAYFDFNDNTDPAVAVDLSGNSPDANLFGAAAFTDDANGFSGTAGDRALNLGAFNDGSYAETPTGSHLDLAVILNAVSVAWWQLNDGDGAGGFNGTTSFWLTAPLSDGGSRGFQIHAPWSNGSIFFDQSGCCDGPERLTVGGLTTAGVWQHMVVQRDADGNREIWVDGVLGASAPGADPLDPFDGGIFLGVEGPTKANGFNGSIDDFAIFAGTLSSVEVGLLAAGSAPSSIAGAPADADNDGLPDAWEDLYGLATDDDGSTDVNNGPDGDPDMDGLTNLEEFNTGLEPDNDDFDNDGLLDGAETGGGTYTSETDTGTDPKNPDTDGDGLLDGVENPMLAFVDVNQPGTDPNLADTDGDLFGDLLEIDNGSDPTDANSVPPSAELTLLAYFNFDGQLADQTGNTPDAVLGGTAVLTTGGMGQTGGGGDEALDLGAAGDGAYAQTPAGTHFDQAFNSNAMSVVFWQFATAFGNTSAFWIHAPTADGGQRGFQAHTPWSNGTIFFDQSGCCDAPERLTTTGAVANQWQHFVFQRDEIGNREIWIDGVLAGSADGADPLDAFDGILTLGAEGPTLANSFAGRLDDFAIFATALGPDQIAELVAGASPPDLISPPVPFIITSIDHDSASGSTTIEWNSRPNKGYAIDASDDLTAWEELDDGIASEGETTSYSVDLPIGTRRKYYQVREITGG
jgi:hypothetical protein